MPVLALKPLNPFGVPGNKRGFLYKFTQARRLTTFERSEVDGEDNLEANFTLSSARCHPRPVGRINRIAVTEWATPMAAQRVDHLEAIGAKPVTITHPLHFSSPFMTMTSSPKASKSCCRNRR